MLLLLGGYDYEEVVMVKVQVELNREQNRKVEIYKAVNGLSTKAAAIEKMVQKHEN